MSNKTTTLGIGAALIGVAAALVGAVLAGKGTAKKGGVGVSDGQAASLDTGTGSAPAGDTSPQTSVAAAPDADKPLLPPAAPPSVADSDGPSGPTAPAQPSPTGQEGHAAPDLAADNDLGPDHRAPEAFRPDMDAPMTAAEREALRPAIGPTPSLVTDEGGSVQGVGGDR